MTMFMCRNKEIQTVAITNRHLVQGDFIEQIKKIIEMKPESIVLREKDLIEEEYAMLARKVLELAKEADQTVYLHTFYQVARELNVENLHVPLAVLEKMTKEEKREFAKLGVSIHSAEEARLAEKLGATRLFAGHIFPTSCKSDLPARGLDFLEQVCKAVSIPVFAIGGIQDKNAWQCLERGAAGVCKMSEFNRG